MRKTDYMYVRLVAQHHLIDALSDAFRLYHEALLSRETAEATKQVPPYSAHIEYHPFTTKEVDKALKRIVKKIMEREKFWHDHERVSKYAELKALYESL